MASAARKMAASRQKFVSNLFIMSVLNWYKFCPVVKVDDAQQKLFLKKKNLHMALEVFLFWNFLFLHIRSYPFTNVYMRINAVKVLSL